MKNNIVRKALSLLLAGVMMASAASPATPVISTSASNDPRSNRRAGVYSRPTFYSRSTSPFGMDGERLDFFSWSKYNIGI
jgi:hypothetical protein